MMEHQVRINERILVPLDGPASAELVLSYARALAAPNATLVLTRVVPAAESEERGEVTRRDLAEIAERLRGDAPGLHVEVVISTGDPAAEIVRVGAERGVDLVVMASQGQRGTEGWTFEETAGQVAATAAAPVMVVRPRDGLAPDVPAIDRLVVPLDGSQRAAQALPIAAALARPLDLPVHLVTVLDIGRMVPPGIAYQAATDPALFDDLFAGAKGEAYAVLQQGARELRRDGLTVTSELLVGQVVAAIAGALRPGDIVVLTSHGRTDPTRRPFGSVAEALVHAGSVPVVVVRFAPVPDVVVPLCTRCAAVEG